MGKVRRPGGIRQRPQRAGHGPEGFQLGRERGEINFPDDGYVSGLHARVTNRDGRVFLADLGSSNGSFVRIYKDTVLSTGDVLLMGQQLFRVAVNA